MSKNKETGEWSQGKGKPYSFKLKDEYHDLFINLHQTLEAWNGGEPLTKTQVFEWMIMVSAKEVQKAEDKALKQYRMQTAEP